MLYPIFESQILPKSGVQIKLKNENIQIFRFEHHWECYHVERLANEPLPSSPTFSLIEERPQQWLKCHRWVSGEQESTFRCYARMPESNFIVFPSEPIMVPRDRKPKLYASIPLLLWVQIGTSKIPLWTGFFEPVKQTWFGKNTRAGELALTLPDTLVVTESELPPPASAHFRAWMELRVSNRDAEPLRIERLSLPAHYFPVYQLDNECFWTYPLGLSKERLLDELRVNHGKEITQRHEHKKLVGEAHSKLEVRTIMRALEAIIG